MDTVVSINQEKCKLFIVARVACLAMFPLKATTFLCKIMCLVIDIIVVMFISYLYLIMDPSSALTFTLFKIHVFALMDLQCIEE